MYKERNEDFWVENEGISEGRVKLSAELVQLLNRMWREKPEERMTVDQIKESRWFNEPVYTKDELKVVMENYVSTSQISL